LFVINIVYARRGKGGKGGREGGEREREKEHQRLV